MRNRNRTEISPLFALAVWRVVLEDLFERDAEDMRDAEGCPQRLKPGFVAAFAIWLKPYPQRYGKDLWWV
jgi:hypothetical protein